MRCRTMTVLFFIVLALAATTAWAQTVSSSVKGVVVDPSGAVIPGAACALTDQATGRTLEASAWSDGNFTFPNVPPGTYTLRIEASGFKVMTVTGVVVHTSEVRTLGNLTLRVGEVKESVSVSAEIAVVQVQLASGEKSGLVSGDQLNSIALKGRDFFGMLQTLPGVVDTNAGRETLHTTSIQGIYINGGSDRSKNYSVDGVFSLNSSNGTTAIQPNLDAIGEVKVLTANYAAEYGRMSSGVISVITKSGTSDFHGSGWANFRNEALNANSFFNNARGTPKSSYRYRTYGYSIGGPIYIPKRFNTGKDKLFFFFSQEYSPLTKDYGSRLVTTPSEAERKGDFSHSYDVNGALIVVKDPLSGLPFPGNIVPVNRISRAGQALLNAFPVPNFADPDPKNLYKWNLISTYSGPTDIRNDVLRIDYNPVPTLNVSYRYMRNVQTDTKPWDDWKTNNNFLLTPLTTGSPGRSHMIQATKTFSPTLVNDAKFAYTLSNPYSDFVDPSKMTRAAFGNLPELYPDPGVRDKAPNAYFGGQPANTIRLISNPVQPWSWRGRNFTLADNLSKVWSRHTLKVGFNWDRYRATSSDTRGPASGTFDFARASTNPFDSGHGFSNALLGNFASYTELSRLVTKDTLLNVFEMYVQDDWRVSRRLTLNLGLRTVSQPPEYDVRPNSAAHFDPSLYVAGNSPAIYVPARDANGKRAGMDPISGTFVPAAYIGLFVPNTGDPANGSAVCGSNGHPRGCFTRSPIFLQPRFGFAYDVFGNGATAVRGGFGIFFDTPDANSFESSAGNPPISYTPSLFFGNLDTMASGTGLIGPSNMPSQAAIGHLPLPMTMNFSLGIQHQTRGILFDVSYVGSQARHSLMRRELNPIPMFARFDPANADPTSPGKALPDNFMRRYAGYGSITPYEMSGNSNYNALQIAVNRRLARGLQFGVSYTFSKVLGDTAISAYFPTRQWNYGPLSHDRSQAFVFNYIYDLPNLGAKSGFRPASWILDNWQLSGITSFISGAPFTPGFSTTDGQDITGSSEGPRILVVGDPKLDQSERTFYKNFNTSAFARPALGTFGNAGVGILRGPGISNWDIALAKRFPLGSEARFVQFRTEFFNAWNHTQFSALNTSARFNPAGQQINPTFGAYTATRPPRIIEISARVVF